jgi:predicted dehydrogenase
MGGVEANCRAEFRFATCTARVQLSRDWARPNIYLFEGDAGRLTWTVNEADVLKLSLGGTGLDATLKLHTQHQDASRRVESTFEDYFTLQIVAMAGAIRNRNPPPVPARAGRDVLALIDQCYRERQQIVLPWLNFAEQSKAAHLAGAMP